MSQLFSHWTEFAAGHGLRLAGILLLALLLNRVLRAFTKRLVRPAGSDSAGRVARMREKHSKALAGFLYTGGTTAIIGCALFMALPEFGFNILPIAVVAGLAGLAIGFGAQHVVRDVINGLLVIAEDQYVEGDSVRIGDVSGRVEQITLRRTVLRSQDGAVITIPNGEIALVANLSRDWGQLFVDIVLPAGDSTEPAMSALERVSAALRTDSSWSPMLVDGPRVLGVESLGPSGITLRMQVRTIPGRQDEVARELRRRIQDRFEQEQIRWGGVQRVELIGSEVPEARARAVV